MQRAFGWLIAMGYPRQGVDWVRRRRLPVIVALACLSWLLLIGLGWAVVQLFA